MTDTTKKGTELAGRLPALKAKANPFKVVQLGEPPGPSELVEQARSSVAPPTSEPVPESRDEAVPSISAPPRGGATKPPRVAKAMGRRIQSTEPARGEPETNLVRLQTLVPFEAWLALKHHCALNRTSINDALRTMVEKFVAKQG